MKYLITITNYEENLSLILAALVQFSDVVNDIWQHHIDGGQQSTKIYNKIQIGFFMNIYRNMKFEYTN